MLNMLKLKKVLFDNFDGQKVYISSNGIISLNFFIDDAKIIANNQRIILGNKNDVGIDIKAIASKYDFYQEFDNQVIDLINGDISTVRSALLEMNKQIQISQTGHMLVDAFKEEYRNGIHNIFKTLFKHINIDLCVGDQVLFNKFAGTELTLENTDYIILKYCDILAVIDKE